MSTTLPLAYAGTIVMWPSSDIPDGWLVCNGTNVSSNNYMTLYLAIGTTFGGSGASSFSLPNLSGRFPMGVGDRSFLGKPNGAPESYMTRTQFPAHNHAIDLELNLAPVPNATVAFSIAYNDTDTNTVAQPTTSTVLGKAGNSVGMYSSNPSTGKMMAQLLQVSLPTSAVTAEITITGPTDATDATDGAPQKWNELGDASYPIPTIPPYVGVNYIICATGPLPPRPS